MSPVIFVARSGSSPLARGLHRVLPRLTNRRRIIPARAGFTFISVFLSIGVPDHPRSRGVYEAEVRSDGPVAVLGIIPARAGFTLGVCVLVDPPMGSSPLARGLRRGPAADERVMGIIPARAGFTRPTGGCGRSRSDHPRSRGVYENVVEAASWVLGSSPLARGLRDRRSAR